MARGINKVIIVGNLGQDPESRTFPDGGQVTNVTVATTDSWKDKQGQPQERTEWHRVVFRDRLAGIAAQYLRKGSKVYVEGSLKTRKWQDKQTGQDRYSTEIVAREMQMLDSRSDSQGGQAPEPQQGYQPQQQGYQNQPNPTYEKAAAQQSPDGGNFDDFDDDIPF